MRAATSLQPLPTAVPFLHATADRAGAAYMSAHTSCRRLHPKWCGGRCRAASSSSHRLRPPSAELAESSSSSSPSRTLAAIGAPVPGGWSPQRRDAALFPARSYIIMLWRFMQRMMPPKDDVGKQAKRRRRRPLPGFDAVAGIDSAKRELEEVVDFIKRPERYTRLGARFPKGVLMHGSPPYPPMGPGVHTHVRTHAHCPPDHARILRDGQDPPRPRGGARGRCVAPSPPCIALSAALCRRQRAQGSRSSRARPATSWRPLWVRMNPLPLPAFRFARGALDPVALS